MVLIGGGHAHVQVLRRWAMKPPLDARLMVVLDQSVAVYSGMVPGFVAGDYALPELEIDVLPLARRAKAGVILNAATDLDPVRKEIALEGRPPIRFDFASVDVGSTVRGLDLPGVREHALSTRPIGRFVRQVDARIEGLSTLGRPPRILIVGGGAAGTELAFTLEARLRSAGLNPQLSVVTGDADLLRGGSAKMRELIAKEADSRGIEIIPNRRVARVEADGVLFEADSVGASEARREADLVIWATGAAPIEFPRDEGLARLRKDEKGFLEVRSTLQTVGFDEVFAVGDCARLIDHPWVPKAGVYAVRQGPILDHNLRAQLEGKRLKDYVPQKDFLALLHLGNGRAAGSKWGQALSSTTVLRLKDWIDRRFMERFQVLDDAGTPRPKLEKLGAMGADSNDESSAHSHGENEMACGGCAAKLGAAPLAAALAELPKAPEDASVVLGLDARDDVAATLDENGKTTLHNVDVIRAFCDDPWLVGRVAASNALSDLFAKGGIPRHAQAVIGLPDIEPSAAQEILFQTLSGLRETLDASGVSLLGGHTTIGDDLTAGLSVTGDAPADGALLRQAGAQIGDLILLTQPIGTGVLLAADMQGLALGRWIKPVQAAMQHTNLIGGRLAAAAGVHASTDVTGFGLAGHLLTLLDDDGRVAELNREAIPIFEGAQALFDRGLRSTAHPANRTGFLDRIVDASELDEAWLFDPQTAGGLLLCVAEEQARGMIRAFDEAGEPPVHILGRIAHDPDLGARPGHGLIRVRSADQASRAKA
ncbi:MAG: selenide, water dikinase SelD [Myxococcota bacterium]